MDEGLAKDSPLAPIRLALHISGGVQGVFYRRDAQREARRLNLVGFVRNEADGSVYAEAQGPSSQVGAFLRWCRKGPPKAQVDSIETKKLPLKAGEDSGEDSEGFEIHYG